jgi:acetyltransferase
MMRITQLNPEEAQKALPELIALLKDAVDSGASIGFLPPLDPEEGAAYWRKRIQAIAVGEALLFTIYLEDELVGTAQLGLETRTNGNHRAEVQKVIVHTDFRRRGIGKVLIQAIEKAAIDAKRSLLVLDTLHGEAAELLYQGMGYQLVGIIPYFAKNADGGLDATAVYYKFLGA